MAPPRQGDVSHLRCVQDVGCADVSAQFEARRLALAGGCSALVAAHELAGGPSQPLCEEYLAKEGISSQTAQALLAGRRVSCLPV